jgi:hypothetical protein
MASVFAVGVSQLEVLDQGRFAVLPSCTPERLADSFIAGTADRPCRAQQGGMHRMAVEALLDDLPEQEADIYRRLMPIQLKP